MKLHRLQLLLCSLVVGAVLVSPVFADPYGIDKTAAEAGLDAYTNDLPTATGTIVGSVLSLVAVAFFALMIYGGILWMTARGNDDQTKKAFDTIVAAVIGVVIVLAAYAITTFALNIAG